MKVIFYASAKEREEALADAFVTGVNAHSHDAEVRLLKPKGAIPLDADVVCMVGVKSRELWRKYQAAGINTVYFDKSYSRSGWDRWRVSVNSHHPTSLLAELDMPSKRFERLGLNVRPWRTAGKHIIFAGSSEKYHNFYSLMDPTAYARRHISRIAKLTRREIVYRPKPSWTGAVPVSGARYSRPPETMDMILENAHALVTHGSNACFEAMLAGVPSIILGDAVAKPISSTDYDNIEAPRLAADAERMRLLSNLAYFQWALHEMASGEAWDFLKRFLPFRQDSHYKTVVRLLGVGHGQRGYEPEDTLNRLFQKTCGPDAPLLSESTVEVALEKRSIASVIGLAAPVGHLLPASRKSPIILVNYRGKDRLIDGSKRIHLLDREGKKAISAYVLTVK